jgi:hypothetical protein
MTLKGPRGGTHANLDQLNMRKVWRTKAWKARTLELLLANERCEWCNGKSSVINHKKQGFYPGYELCRREEVDIICQPCHQYWTKTGLQRPRMYDECTSCASVIYYGRKVCWMCGGKTAARKVPLKNRETIMGIYASCPEVRIGDAWQEVWLWESSEIQIEAFVEQPELPWPLVKTSKGEVGLPAFKFGKRLTEGSGASWEDFMGFSREVNQSAL